MSNVRAVVRNSTVLLAGTAASKALVFLSTLYLVRALGAEGFGLYSLVFAYLAFFEMVPDAGLDSVVVREAARRPPEAGRIVGDALLMRAGLALLVLPVAVAGFGLVSDDPRAPWLAGLGAIAWISSVRRPSLRSLFETPYRLALRMHVPTALGVFSEAAHLGLLVAVLGTFGLPGAVAAQGLAPLPFLALLVIRSMRRLRPVLSLDRARIVALARLAAPVLALLFANIVLVRIDVVMLQMLRGAREVGIYTAPVRLVEVANLLPALLMTSVYPLFASSWPGDPARVDRLFRTSLRLLAAVVVPVALLEVAFAGPLVQWLFGADYEASAAVLPLLAASLPLVYADIVFNSRFIATGRERSNVRLVVVAAATNIALNLFLIPAYGAAGAAAATLAAYAVRLLATLVPADTRDAAGSAGIALAPAVAAGAAALLAARALGGVTPAGLAAGGVVYAAALLAARGVRGPESREVLAALRRPRP